MLEWTFQDCSAQKKQYFQNKIEIKIRLSFVEDEIVEK